jgi:hypothetical protein
MAISLLDYAAQTTSPMRKGLVEIVTNSSIFMKYLNFIPVDGFTYQYPRQQTLGGIQYRSINTQYTDKSVGVINPEVETLPIFGGEVDTDRKIAKLASGASVRANLIASKVKRAGLFYDHDVVHGDPAVTPGAIMGLASRLTGPQVIAAGTNGAALTLLMMDDLLDAVLGDNSQKKLVMCRADRRALAALYRPTLGGTMQRFPKEYEEAEIIDYDELGDYIPLLAKNETMGSSSVTSSIYCFRPGSDVDGESLQGLINSDYIEHDDQGVRGTTYIDLIECGAGIALFHPRGAARLQGLL